MDDKKIIMTLTTGTIIKTIAVLLVIAFIYFVRNIMVAVLFSVVIASGIDPAASFFQKRKIPRVLAVSFIYLIISVLLGGIFYLIVPSLFSELSIFADRIPSYLEKPFEVDIVDKIFGNLPVFARDAFGGAFIKINDYIASLSSGLFSLIFGALGGIASLTLIIVISFYLSVQNKGIENFIRTIIPDRYETYAINLWMRWKKKTGLWLQGQILLGLIVGIMTYVGLIILKADYALTFALLAAIFELLPIFGPILAAVPPVAIMLLSNPFLALKILILYIIIQQLENHLIYPIVVKKIVGVPSIIVILALVIGFQLGGIFGILLSIPLAALAVEILDDIGVRKKQIKEKLSI